MQDLTFVIGPDRAVAEIWETLGAAGITMEASCTFPTTDGRNVRVVVSDEQADAARGALLESGFGALDQHPVVVTELEAASGSLGRLARAIADTGAQLHTLYMARGDRVVVGADDLEKVKSVI